MALASRSWRLIDDLDRPRDAAAQMAADLALLDEVADGADPALRLYRWTSPALTLGRFQSDDDVNHEACRRLGVEVARRPTGGKALLHGGDVTYAVAMPLPAGPSATVDGVYTVLARALITGLTRVGVEAAVARHEGPADAVCMATQQGADLRVGDRKVCGSAQVHQRGTVLQHGSVLLRRLAFDETDLVRDPPPRSQLRAATVTLSELDAPSDARIVARALIEGFELALDVRFTLSVETSGS